MPSTSRRTSRFSGTGSEKTTVSVLLSGVATPSMLVRLRPSSAVTFVDEPAKVEPCGSVSVTEVISSPSSTVPSHVRRVGRPPMTLEPPFSLGRAVALLVVIAWASVGSISATISARMIAPSATFGFLDVVRLISLPSLCMQRDPGCAGAPQWF